MNARRGTHIEMLTYLCDRWRSPIRDLKTLDELKNS